MHSTQLGAAYSLGTGTTVLYTVPAGYRTILKSIVIHNNAAAAQQPYVGSKHSGTYVWEARVALTANGTVGDTAYIAPWIVLNPGDTLQVVPGAASINIVLSGAELKL